MITLISAIHNLPSLHTRTTTLTEYVWSPQKGQAPTATTTGVLNDYGIQEPDDGERTVSAYVRIDVKLYQPTTFWIRNDEKLLSYPKVYEWTYWHYRFALNCICWKGRLCRSFGCTTIFLNSCDTRYALLWWRFQMPSWVLEFEYGSDVTTPKRYPRKPYCLLTQKACHSSVPRLTLLELRFLPQGTINTQHLVFQSWLSATPNTVRFTILLYSCLHSRRGWPRIPHLWFQGLKLVLVIPPPLRSPACTVNDIL